MDADSRRREGSRRDRILEPQQDVVARSVLIVAEVVVETELVDAAGLQQGDGFLVCTAG